MVWGRQRTVALATGTAVWYHAGMPLVALRWVLIRDPLGEFEPQALLCTDAAVAAPQIVEWLVLRWQVEVTFEEACAHLGVETQRQWSDRAILRTTPALRGLFAVVTLLAHRRLHGRTRAVRQAAWYAKQLPTLVDALALVRQELWLVPIISTSPAATGTVEIPRALLARFTETLAYTA